MAPRDSDSREPTPDMNRDRYYAHQARLTRRAHEQAALLAARKLTARTASPAAAPEKTS
jgi:hypothetical protein